MTKNPDNLAGQTGVDFERHREDVYNPEGDEPHLALSSSYTPVNDDTGYFLHVVATIHGRSQ